jgi:hypothetical protein
MLGNIFYFLGTNLPGDFQRMPSATMAIVSPIAMAGLTYLVDTWRTNPDDGNTILYSTGEVVMLGVTIAATIRSGEYFFPHDIAE